MKKVAHQFFEDDGLDYEDMLNDFDNFCDQFEDRASKAYHLSLIHISEPTRPY